MRKCRTAVEPNAPGTLYEPSCGLFRTDIALTSFHARYPAHGHLIIWIFPIDIALTIFHARYRAHGNLMRDWEQAAAETRGDLAETLRRPAET